MLDDLERKKKSLFPTGGQNSGIFRMQAACWLTMSSHRSGCGQSRSYPVAKELSQEKNLVQSHTANRFLSMICPSDCSKTGWEMLLEWAPRKRRLGNPGNEVFLCGGVANENRSQEHQNWPLPQAKAEQTGRHRTSRWTDGLAALTAPFWKD